ncbi:MAG: hypothetical protein M1820_001358 [Bogoriella megaspora]|nr:MAG: hypothetical protein M1820_001358 [Bogoriella megaspora]
MQRVAGLPRAKSPRAKLHIATLSSPITLFLNPSNQRWAYLLLKTPEFQSDSVRLLLRKSAQSSIEFRESNAQWELACPVWASTGTALDQITPSLTQPSETSGLLYEDPYTPQYGATAQQPNIPQPDPEELRREREALESLCTQTSEQLIDVAQRTQMDEGVLKMGGEYSRLFTDYFGDSRPSTAESSDEESVEEAWLNTEGGLQDNWSQLQPMDELLTTINVQKT